MTGSIYTLIHFWLLHYGSRQPAIILVKNFLEVACYCYDALQIIVLLNVSNIRIMNMSVCMHVCANMCMHMWVSGYVVGQRWLIVGEGCQPVLPLPWRGLYSSLSFQFLQVPQELLRGSASRHPSMFYHKQSTLPVSQPIKQASQTVNR